MYHLPFLQVWLVVKTVEVEGIAPSGTRMESLAPHYATPLVKYRSAFGRFFFFGGEPPNSII
jgi:hypothetical protein